MGVNRFFFAKASIEITCPCTSIRIPRHRSTHIAGLECRHMLRESIAFFCQGSIEITYPCTYTKTWRERERERERESVFVDTQHLHSGWKARDIPFSGAARRCLKELVCKEQTYI